MIEEDADSSCTGIGVLALAGLIGTILELAAFVNDSVTQKTGIEFALFFGTPAGYTWLLFTCFDQNRPQSDRALTFIFYGGAALGLASVPLVEAAPDNEFAAWIVLSGIWILNALGVEKLLRELRRIRRVMNDA